MRITNSEIKHVAQLARLEVDDQEVEQMASQLDKILGYVDKLNELDTDGVKPTTHALSVTNAFRDDTLRPSLPQEKALENGPLQDGSAFVVPKVI